MAFNFERWIEKYGLQDIKQVFKDNDMCTLKTLNMNNKCFPKLMSDPRTLTKPHLMQNVIKGIQALEMNKPSVSNNTSYDDKSEETMTSKPLQEHKKNNDTFHDENKKLENNTNINGVSTIISNPTDEIYEGSDEALDVIDEKKDIYGELTGDDVYEWCKKYGFEKYYDLFVDNFGIETSSDIIKSSMDDLFSLCDELQFTEKERKHFLSIIIKSNANNELSLWCKKNKLDQFYELFIKHGYFAPIQICQLPSKAINKLCKEIGIKFGNKRRFIDSLREIRESQGIIDIKDRKIGHITSDQLENNNDTDILLNRTILMVGETGTGKTTTINSMMNYLYNAEFEGNRYKLIIENFDKKATESQTEEVSVYYLKPPAIDYTLTIIDTPGYGNCDGNGIEFDENITSKLKHLFKTTVKEVDGICFVIKSNQTRLTQRQQYIFTQIINLFANNVTNNIILLFTFDDGTKIPAGLEAVKNNKPSPIPHRDKYFVFNNNPFDFDLDLDDKNRCNFNKVMATFGDFFEELTKIQTQSLQLSHQVLQQRNRLKLKVKCVQQRLKEGLTIHQSIINKIKEIEKNKDEIDKNDETLLTVEVPKTKKVYVKLKKKRNNDKFEAFLVCQDCKVTCEWWKCPKCGNYYPIYDCIVKVKYKYVLELENITVPVRKLKSGYLDEALFESLSDMLITKETQKLKHAERDLIELILQIRICINKIKELALNKTLLTSDDFFKLLIEEETKNCNNGWGKRVKAIETLRDQHTLIANIENSMKSEHIEAVSIFPEYDKIKTFQEELEEKEKVRIAKRKDKKQKNIIDADTEKQRKRNDEFRTEKRLWLFERDVFNYTYDDILKDFCGHLGESDDRGTLMPTETATGCCTVCVSMNNDHYKTREYTDYNRITSQGDIGSFLQWMILYPKNKNRNTVYLTFKGSSELSQLIKNTASTPHKILSSNNKSEEIEVHGTMHAALMRDFTAISNELLLKIHDENSLIKQCYITGHGLGGGLAILYGYELIRCGLINKQQMEQCEYNIVTFGAPSVLACSRKIPIKTLETNKNLQLLNSICHCYINRLDPVPRLIRLLYELPHIMKKMMIPIMDDKISIFKKKPSKNIKNVWAKLESTKLSSVYFSVGKQYIWCGTHKKSYCGEQMKIRTQYDIVTSFGPSTFKNAPLDLWKTMFRDHLIEQYKLKLKNKTILI